MRTNANTHAPGACTLALHIQIVSTHTLSLVLGHNVSSCIYYMSVCLALSASVKACVQDAEQGGPADDLLGCSQRKVRMHETSMHCPCVRQCLRSDIDASMFQYVQVWVMP